MFIYLLIFKHLNKLGKMYFINCLISTYNYNQKCITCILNIGNNIQYIELQMFFIWQSYGVKINNLQNSALECPYKLYC